MSRANLIPRSKPLRVPEEPAAFPITRWDRIHAAGISGAEGRDAIADLCTDYWPPVFVFLRRRGFSEADAQDLTQGFFLHLLEHQTTRRADAKRGKFRSFLLGALKHYLANEAQWAGRQKRGGRCEILSMDDPQFPFTQLSCESDASRLYDERWAQEVVNRALERLRGKFTERMELFSALEGFLDGAGNGPSLAEAASALNLSEGALRTAVSRLRKQFGEQLRLEIARTVSAPHEIEQELQCLRAVLTAKR